MEMAKNGVGNDALFYDTFYTISGYQRSPSYIKHLIVGHNCSHPSRPVNVSYQGVIQEWFCSDQCACRNHGAAAMKVNDNEDAIHCFMENLSNVQDFVHFGTLPSNGTGDGVDTRQAQNDAETKIAIFNLYHHVAEVRNEQANERVMRTHRLLYAAFCELPLRVFHFSKKVTHRYPVIFAYDNKKQAERARTQLDLFLSTRDGKEEYPYVKCEGYKLPY